MAVVEMPKRFEIGERLVELGWRSTTLMHELVTTCADFEDSSEWMLGYRTPAHWIADRLDVKVSTAREWLRIGRLLRDLPVMSRLFREGELSYSKVRALSRFAESSNENELCKMATRVPAGQLNRLLAAWFKKNHSDEEVEKHQQEHRGIFVSQQPDGSYRGVIDLPALPGGKVMAAINAKVLRSKPNASADACPSLAQQRADALVELVTEGGAKVEAEVILHVRGDGATMNDGTPITDTVVKEIASKSFIRALIHDAEGKPINASGKQRHPTERQKRVVSERHDNRCVDCGSTDLIQYDHTPDFEDTKHTVVDELEPRCAPCHRLRHKKAG